MQPILRRLVTRTPFYKIYPNCAECINYIKYKDDAYSRCAKFGFENIITDEIEYEYADYARRSESKCGHDGRYYVRGSIVRSEK